MDSSFSDFGLRGMDNGALPNKNFGSSNDAPVNEPASSHRS
nr:MAG TPA: hypothetical protein [Caudoviricetes sp.]DAN83462.1 MAG TPA: hypothetical protein [Caudoviricetes sp.]DAZ55858.1 MAG TPA: hypothetical protein [Caudoviricetes sp.]